MNAANAQKLSCVQFFKLVIRISYCGYLHSNSLLPLALKSATKTKYLLHFVVVPISIRKQLKAPCQLAKPRSRLAIRRLLTAESDRRATSDERREPARSPAKLLGARLATSANPFVVFFHNKIHLMLCFLKYRGGKTLETNRAIFQSCQLFQQLASSHLQTFLFAY